MEEQEVVIDLDKLVEEMVSNVIIASKPRTDELQTILDYASSQKNIKKSIQKTASEITLSDAYILTKEEFSIIIESFLNIIMDIQGQNDDIN